MISLKYDEETIRKKRKLIADRLKEESETVKSDKIERIGDYDLELLYDYYDEIFFDNWFKENFKGIMMLNFSRRLTKSAGMTKCPKNISQIPEWQTKLQINMGIDFFFKFDHLEENKYACGIECKSSLEALQIILEHELLHAHEYILHHESNCKKDRFKHTAKNMFGHTQSHHSLPSNSRIIREKYGIFVGDKVRFKFKNKRLTGVVTRINKRATVMVLNPDGQYVDQHGNKYVKYFVPANCLDKVCKKE